MQPFEDVVKREGPVVFRVCRALLGPLEAEDAWAETFLAALQAYPRLTPGSNVRGWLVTIAHRKAIDQLRSAARRPPPAALDEGRAAVGSAGPDDRFEHDDLRDALARLPAKAQACVVYRYLADLPYEAVAELLDISPAAARRNAADGIAKLRRDPRLQPAEAPTVPDPSIATGPAGCPPTTIATSTEESRS